MALILQNTPSSSANPQQSSSIELVYDLELYYEFSKELSLLHSIAYEPDTDVVDALIKKLQALRK